MVKVARTSMALQRETKIQFDLLKATKQISADDLLLELIEHYKKTTGLEIDVNDKRIN